MDFKKLFINNKAVSPVIGVILMVAITVILAAAIGSAVFGQGTAEPAPQANLGIEIVRDYINYGGDEGSDPAIVRFQHLGGDPINFQKTDKTKILVTVSDTTYVVPGKTVNKQLNVLSVGDVKTLELIGKDNANIPIPAGSTVNIKIVDIKTNQLIFDGELRF
ncbi:type IV pilin [Methanosarcina sp. MSH10X1]|uniref:type IV pilin n=1 Tax=Methanosarcina sp. MSH10X1 TaxID=2507075 RepID=UPI000FFB090E|nr:type IV pilin [Methanosarcina sp. MSH10X1]RXA21344.1 type IV pilin [Methanosarcina sp. MSH10X1]